MIFQTQPGVAVAFRTEGDIPVPVSFDGWSGRQFFVQKSIITQMAIEREGNFKFVHTLKDLIHLYVFGEKIGRIRVAGLSFSDICPGNGTKTGIERVAEYYDRNSIARRPTPINIQIGTTPSGNFVSFLTRLSVNIIQPESRIAQFGLEFSAMPQRRSSGGGTGT